MKRYLKIIKQYSLNSIKISLEHKGSAVLFLFGKLLRFGMSALFIYFLLSKTTFLAGYTLTQTMLFYVTYSLIDSITQQLFREVYRFRPLIISGDFDTVLVKPVHPFVRVLVGGFDILDILPTILYVGLSTYLITLIPGLDAAEILWYVLLVCNGLLIATAFHIMVLALGIFSTEVDHTIMIYRDITRLGAFPIDIYSEPLKSVLTFVIPIGIMVSFPVKSVLGILSPNLVIISFGIGLLFLTISIMMWQASLAKYQSASS